MAAWHREYKYRKAMGGTHADYLDTPEETIEAMLRISDAYADGERRANEAASRG
jgi:nitroimidazol reductase NimA-like FMN-containing flavoprotein (pyridoxamine 5'-phosphate oxidase superfamily)